MALTRTEDSASAAIIEGEDVLKQKHIADKAALCQKQLDALKAALQKITEQQFLEIGAQVVENCEQLVHCAEKYRKQDPQNTQASDLLFQEIAAQVECFTTAMTSFNINSPNSFPVKALKSSEKNLGEAIRRSTHAYLYSEPLGDSLKRYRVNRNFFAMFASTPLISGVISGTLFFIFPPVSIVPVIIAIFMLGMFACLCAYTAYQYHKEYKNKISNSQIFREFTVLQQKNTKIIDTLIDTLPTVNEFHQLENGKTLLRRGDLEEGLACFRRVPKASPYYGAAMLEHACALTAESRHPEALTYYRKASGLHLSLEIPAHLAKNDGHQAAQQFLMGIYSKEKAKEKLTEKTGDRTLSPLSRCGYFTPATAKAAQQGQAPGSDNSLSLDY